ncbi:complement factor H-like isoform X2 [Gymnodraco acuticeps]|uniref:Complement factor H-like isoform X2 n=1 Tax=Gymnodraco acuticeps TaxID=8218 RepID=A0A6P8W4A7_GYMAC|nr:complement factor H-like isoform X2 [Gymnodraco acuticeps]
MFVGSPTPLCEPITCKLQLPGLKGTSYEPAYRNMFLAGEQVTVNCGNNHWIFSHQQVSVVTTCKEDGEWTITPECQEVTCSKRGVPHVSWDSRWQLTLKSGEMTRYGCARGYRRKDDRNDMATCTRDGWHPNPLCQVIACPQPGYPNAGIVGIDLEEYEYKDKVRFICNNGYEGEFTVTCGVNGWSRGLQCTERRCEKPHIDDANFIGDVSESYRQNDHIQYTCKNNVDIIVTLTCEENGWNETQSCSEVLGCGTAPIIADGDLKYARKSNNSHNEMVEYMCQAYYTMEGEPYKTCVNGVWTGHMRCIQPCTVNEDDNRQHNITFKYNGSTYFTHDEIIGFRCARGIPVGSVSLLQRCNSGVIVLPTCQEF